MVERVVASALRRDGLLAKVPRDARGVCADHAFELLGFTSAWELVRFVDSLDVPRGGKRRRSIRLPSWKAATAGLRSVRAIRTGDAYGWAFVVVLRKPREAKAA